MGQTTWLPLHRLPDHEKLPLRRAMHHPEILVFELKAVTGWDLTYGEWVLYVEKKVPTVI